MPSPSIALPGRNYLAIVKPWVVGIPSCPSLNWLIKQTLCARNCTFANVVLWNFTPSHSLFLIRMRYCGFSDVPCFFQHTPLPAPSFCTHCSYDLGYSLTYQVGRLLPWAQISAEASSRPPGSFKCFFCCPVCCALSSSSIYNILMSVCIRACISLPWNRGTLRAGTVSVPFCILNNKVLIGIKFCVWVNGMMNSWVCGRKEKGEKEYVS